MRPPVNRPESTRTQDPLEADLLVRARTGDGEAFRLLLEPHQKSLCQLARRVAGDAHWAEDLLQETLIRAVRGIGGYRGEGSFRTWLYSILVRLASEPKRWRRAETPPPLTVEVPDVLALDPADLAFTRELGDRLDEAMERLPQRQRLALHLRAVEGLDYDRIASVLDCKAGAARMLVLEARRRVMERLGRHLEP